MLQDLLLYLSRRSTRTRIVARCPFLAPSLRAFIVDYAYGDNFSQWTYYARHCQSKTGTLIGATSLDQKWSPEK
jgi:hypothetical protein